MQGIKDEKQLGLIYGTAIGDAWGMAFEMMTYDEIKASSFNPDIINGSLPVSKISKNLIAGNVTDDTINTLMILKVLKDNNYKIKTAAYLNELIKWKKESFKADFVMGPSTSKALEKIINGEPVERAGIMGTSNGAAMKIAPLGIVCDFRKPDELIEEVVKICLPTHNTSIAIQGASVIAAMASYLLRGFNDYYELIDLMKIIIIKAKKYGYNWPSADLFYRIKMALKIIKSDGNVLEMLYRKIGTTIETIDTIPIAVALFFLANGDINKCKKYASAIGGDTDTIGAISCALCGIKNPKLIKKAEVDLIEKVNNINFKDYIL